MLEQGERLGACFRRRLDEWGRARDKCDVLLWDKVQEAAAGRKGEEPSGSGTTRWKQDAKKAADLDSKMCKHIDEIKDEVGPSSSSDAAMLSTDLDEAMGTAFPDEWRTMHKLVSEWQDGKRDGNGEPARGFSEAMLGKMWKEGKQAEDGAQTRKKLEDVEDSQLPCEDEEVTIASVTPLTEASLNSMNETIAKQDELMAQMRAKRKNIAEQDEVLEKKRKGMAPESGKKEEQEVQGRNPQDPKEQICIAGRWIDKEVAADETRLNAYIEQIVAPVKLQCGEQGPNPRLQEQMNPMMIAGEKAKAAIRAEDAQEMEKAKEHGERSKAEAFRVQKKEQARGAAKQAQEMGKATEAKPLVKQDLLPKAAETDKKAAETDKKAAEKYGERSKRQLRETRPTLQDLFTFFVDFWSFHGNVPGRVDFRNDGERFSLLAWPAPPPSNLLSSVSWLHRYP